MNRYFFLTVLSSCLILLAVAGFAAAEDHGDRVCIYKHDNFNGHEECYRPGEQVSDLKNADIGSIRVYGHARAMVYEDRDFRGHMMEFSANVPDLKRVPLTGSKEFHDHIGSLRVASEVAYNSGKAYEPDYRHGRLKPFPGPETIDEGVCVYDRPRFEGRAQCWTSGTDIANLNSGNWASGSPQSVCSVTAGSSVSETPTSAENALLSIMTFRICPTSRCELREIGITKSLRCKCNS